MENTFKGLDRSFNAAVLQLASRLFPTGFDVAYEGTAPETLEAVNAAVAGGRMVVSGDNCEGTAFGDVETDLAFRAWHDWTHWKHQLPFTLEGETATAWMQIDMLRQLGLWSPLRRDWLLAEVVDQARYFADTGVFPEDHLHMTVKGLIVRGHACTEDCPDLGKVALRQAMLHKAAKQGKA